MTEETKISIVGVNEKDIDLLIIEECISSKAFLNKILDKLEIKNAKLIAASRGMQDSNGETDILLKLRNNEEKLINIYIENKVSASFQPRQIERYVERGEDAIEQGNVHSVFLCLVSPNCYLQTENKHEEFNLIFTYEEMINWIKESGIEQNRLDYKVALLNKAIQRAKLGWQPEEDKVITDFYKYYWQRTKELAPILQMDEPDCKPATCFFVHFYPPEKIKGIKLIHKLRHGNVDLQLRGWAGKIHLLEEYLKDILESDMKICRANKSAVIRITLPIINLQKSVVSQEELIELGIKTSNRLYNWYIKNKTKFNELLATPTTHTPE